MAFYKATIEVFMEVDSWAEAADCIAETMRDHCRRYAPESSITDWEYKGGDPKESLKEVTREEAFPYDPSDEYITPNTGG